MNCVGLAKSSGILKFTQGWLQVEHAWKNVESLLEVLNNLHRTLFVYRVHSLWRASAHDIWHSMYFFGLCYCNDRIFLFFFPFPSLPPSVSLVDKGSFCCPVQLCLCVWLWENFLTVRESPPLSGLAFPLGSSRLIEAERRHCSAALLPPATPSGSSGSRIPPPCLPKSLVQVVCMTSLFPK